jgi:hypothetical protein
VKLAVVRRIADYYRRAHDEAINAPRRSATGGLYIRGAVAIEANGRSGQVDLFGYVRNLLSWRGLTPGV